MLPAASQSFGSATKVDGKVENYIKSGKFHTVLFLLLMFVSLPAQQQSSTANPLITHRSENLSRKK